jgi:hypothetical protein
VSLASRPPHLGAGRAVGLSAFFFVLALLAGCAAASWSYSKPGVTPAGLDHDLGACRRQADRPSTFALTRAGRLDQDALNQCMERKGYTARPDG